MKTATMQRNSARRGVAKWWRILAEAVGAATPRPRGWRGCEPLEARQLLTVAEEGMIQEDLASLAPEATATVGGKIWSDWDGDGIQDENETECVNVAVGLWGAEGQWMGGTLASDGEYRFEGLPPGRYWLEFSLAWGYAFTRANQGDDELDSDAEPFTGRTAVFTVSEGQVDLSWDAGLAYVSDIWGRVFNDVDGDGLWDADEENVTGWEVLLDLDRNGVKADNEPTDVTAGFGYHFGELGPGVYRVRLEMPAGWVATNPNGGWQDVDLTPDHSVTEVNFGVRSMNGASIAPVGPAIAVSGDVLGDGNASVAADAQGNFVVTWNRRLSFEYSDIWAQLFHADGRALGEAFQVDTEMAGLQWAPVAGMDADGDFVIAWQSSGFGVPGGIWARRFAPTGVPRGEPFCVSTTAASMYQPTVAMNAAGEFVVAWTRGGGSWPLTDIQARRYDAAGVAQEEEFTVNTATGQYETEPAVAMSPLGGFTIAWRGAGASSDDEIFARCFDASGGALGEAFVVNTTTAMIQRSPALAFDRDGGFVIVWDGDIGNEFYGVYAQRYNALGQAQGGEIPVTPHQDTDWLDPAVAMRADGGFVVAFSGILSASWPAAWIRAYSADGLAETGLVHVNEATSGGQYSPEIAQTPGGFIVAWDNHLNDDFHNSQVYVQRFSEAPQSIVEGVVFNDRDGDGLLDDEDSGLAGWVAYVDFNRNGRRDSSEPSMQTEQNGRYYFVGLAAGTYKVMVEGQDRWLQTAPSTGAYLVTLNAGQQQPGHHFGFHTDVPTGLALRSGEEFKVKLMPGYNPASVAMDAEGNYVVTWGLATSGALTDIYAQRYNSAGAALGEAIRVSQYSGAGQMAPDVAMNADGEFVVVWSTHFRGERAPAGISARRFDAQGQAAGDEILVAAMAGAALVDPAVAMDAAGNFALTWTASGKGVYARRYNASGEARGAAWPVGVFTTHAFAGDIAMDADGDFVAAWVADGPLGGSAVYAHRFAANGAAQGSDFLVGSTSVEEDEEGPTVAMDGAGNFVVAWDEQSPARRSILVQRFNAAGIAQGGVLCLAQSAENYFGAAAAAMNERGDVLVSWHALGDGEGWGVYGQRLSAAGVPVGGVFQANTFWVHDQYAPATAIDADGDFVLVWRSHAQEGGGFFGQRFTANPPAVTATIRAVLPDPRPGPVDEMTIVFSTPVTEFDLTDLRLTRNEGPNLLGLEQKLQSTDGITWKLVGLAGLTFVEGTYRLVLTAEGSKIAGPYTPLEGDAQASFRVTATNVPATEMNDTYRVWLDVQGEDVKILHAAGAALGVLYVVPLADVSVLRFNTLGGDDTITLDFVNGNPVPAGGIVFDGGSGINRLVVVGTPPAPQKTLMASVAGGVRPIDVPLSAGLMVGSTVTAKYTWLGDADMSGSIDATDYFRLARGLAKGLAGYGNGDFNSDGTIDTEDYAVIDRGFLASMSAKGDSALGAAAAPKKRLFGTKPIRAAAKQTKKTPKAAAKKIRAEKRPLKAIAAP